MMSSSMRGGAKLQKSANATGSADTIEQASDADLTMDSLDQVIDQIERQLYDVTGQSGSPEELVLTDLNRCVDSVAEIAWEDLAFECQLEQRFANIPPIMAKQRALCQALLTLFRRAVSSVDRFGEILIATHLEGAEVVLRVANTGRDVSETESCDYFSDRNQTQEYAKISEVVSEHRGTITVVTDMVGGASIELRLPIAERRAIP